MLRSFLRLFAQRTAPRHIQDRRETPAGDRRVTIFAELPAEASSSESMARDCSRNQGSLKQGSLKQSSLNTASRTFAVPAQLPSNDPSNHRSRVLSMRVEHCQLCSPKRAKRLAELGILTAGDLATAEPKNLAIHFGASRKAKRILSQYRRAVRFSASVPGMLPRDAMLLINVHRRSIHGLACDSAAALYRDLERFSESSQGRSLLRGRRLPSCRRLKVWITQCKSTLSNGTLSNAAVGRRTVSEPGMLARKPISTQLIENALPVRRPFQAQVA